MEVFVIRVIQMAKLKCRAAARKSMWMVTRGAVWRRVLRESRSIGLTACELLHSSDRG